MEGGICYRSSQNVAPCEQKFGNKVGEICVKAYELFGYRNWQFCLDVMPTIF